MEKQGNNYKNKAAAFGKSLYTNKDRGPAHLESACDTSAHLTDAMWLLNEAVIYSNS